MSTSTARSPVAVPFWELLGAGAVTVLFGAAVLLWPDATLRLLGLLTGIWLLVVGVMRLAGAFRGTRGEAATHGFGLREVVDAAFGLLLVVVGIACLRNTAAGVVALAVLVALAWLLTGVAALLIGAFAQGRARTWLLGVGAASVVAGLVVLAWPGPSLHALVLLTGISAVLIGAAEVAIAWSLRGAQAART